MTDNDKMREAIIKILNEYTREMEDYDYYRSNLGVSVDDYEDIADEIIAWQAAKSYPKDKPVECANGCPDKQVCDYCQSTAAAMMPCGASVTNVYEAYEAGKQAAKSVPVVGEPVAWRCKDYGDSWILYQNKQIAANHQAQTGCLMRALVLQPATSITEAELERLRKDAERYRWLRSPSAGPATVWRVCMEPMDGGLHTLKSDSCLDEAIDAAIANQKVQDER